MKTLPERIPFIEKAKLSGYSIVVGLLLALVCSFVLPMPFMTSFILISIVMFLDGFIEGSKWKYRLIVAGIFACVFILTNSAAWPILKMRIAARYPTLARILPRTQEGLDLFMAKKANTPAVEAKRILFESIKDQEQIVLTTKVQERIKAGDNEGAAELIRLHQEKLAKIEASIDPEPAKGPGPLNKVKGWFKSSTVKVPPLRGQDVHLSLKAGEETNMASIPLGMYYDFFSCKKSNYMIVLPSGQELHKGENWPEFRSFKIVALSDAEIDLKNKVN